MSNYFYPMQGGMVYPQQQVVIQPGQMAPAYAPIAAPAQYASYVPPAQQPGKIANPIGEDGYKLLRSKGNGGKVNFVISREEMLRSICNHRHNGEFQFNEIAPFTYKCAICGTVVNQNDAFDPEVLRDLINYLAASYEWFKVKNLNVVSNDITSDIGKTIALLKRYPDAYRVVTENYADVTEVAGKMAINSVPNTQNQAVAMMNSAGGYVYTPMYQAQYQSQIAGNPFAPAPQQMVAYPQPQPVMYPPQQQPVMYPQQPVQGYPPMPQQPVMYPPQQQPVQGYPPAPQQVVTQQYQQVPPAANGTVVQPLPQNQQQAPAPVPQQPPVTAPPQNPTAPPKKVFNPS